jgi:hypothetical protein
MVEPRLPEFLIIGAQKSASTYVHSLLRAHPDVCMPSEEVRFFEDPEFGDGDTRAISALFRGSECKLRGIKRPDYLARAEVPARIRKVIPDAKLIAVLREPVARLISAYHHYIKLGLLPAIPFAEGIARLLKGETFGSPRAWEILEYGRYGTHLVRYLELFPADQLFVVLQEDLRSDPAGTVSALHNFLGIENLPYAKRVSKDNPGLYNMHRLRFLRLRNRFMYDYTSATQKLVEKKGPFRYLLAGGITFIDRRILSRLYVNRMPTLDPSVRRVLRDFYEPETERLERILGRSFEAWKRSDDQFSS